jgi:hypothetical protein
MYFDEPLIVHTVLEVVAIKLADKQGDERGLLAVTTDPTNVSA